MAWTELSSTPGPAASNVYVGVGTGVEIVGSEIAVYAASGNTDPNYHDGPWPKNLLGGGPLNAPSLANQGWITLSSYGGGGGSERPETGIMWPRGI